MFRRALFATLAATFVVPSTSFADEDRTGSPYFQVLGAQKNVDRLPLESTRADVSIAGTIAHVRVTQIYKNDGPNPIEAIYVFPGSTRSAVFGMRMTIGERTIKAKIQEREAAKKLYRQAVAQGKSASLLEQKRPNVFQMRVGNIMPGDRITVRLDYTELLVPEEGVYSFVYPTVVGPRFSDPSTREARDNWVTNPYEKSATPLYKWDMTVKLSSGIPVAAVSSETHQVSPTFTSAKNVRIDVDDERGGNRDFILKYRLSQDAIKTGMMLLPGTKEKFFLAMIEPPARLNPSMIPPREYIFIVDVSGSMRGFPLETSKTMMRRLLDGMRSQDKFNIMLFAGGSKVLAERSIVASTANIERAAEFIDQRRGGGSTRLLPAMRRALALPRDDGMSTTMVVLTDGYVSVEKQTFELIRNNLNDANLFAFGIGRSVNRHLIEGMARAGMGEPTIVLGKEQAEAKAEAFRRYISSPVLTDVKVSTPGFQAYDVEPKSFPDLFAQRPVVVFGKYRGRPQGKLQVTGINGQGQYEKTVDIKSEAVASDDNTALRYLWARHRIARLSEIPHDASAKKEITQLGLRYTLMTAYTSFVAIDSQIRNHSGNATEVAQPLPTPSGVKFSSAMALSGRGRGYGGGGNLKNAIRRSRARFQVRSSPAPTALPRPAPKASYPSVAESESATVRGSLDRSAAQRVIRRAQSRIRRAYETALRSNPNLASKIVIEITIAENGRVVKARIKSTTQRNAELEKRLLRIFRKLRFPSRSGGGVIKLTYPIILRPN